MLSDARILHALRWHGLTIDSFQAERLQPASYDLTLGADVKVLKLYGPALDPKVDNTGEYEDFVIGEDGFELVPGMLALGTTAERVGLGDRLKGRVEGKSSLGRLGLEVHRTAGYIDPGFEGHITLELACIRSILLYPGMPVAQLALYDCPGVINPYRGKYTDQVGPVPSKYHLNWDGQGWA